MPFGTRTMVVPAILSCHDCFWSSKATQRKPSPATASERNPPRPRTTATIVGMSRASRIDDTIREYLYPIAVGRLRGLTLPGPLQRFNENLACLITTGFLPQRFRDEMRLPWDPQRQRRFDRLMKGLAAVNNLVPGFVRQFPFNVLLKDLDWRVRTGRPLV